MHLSSKEIDEVRQSFEEVDWVKEITRVGLETSRGYEFFADDLIAAQIKVSGDLMKESIAKLPKGIEVPVYLGELIRKGYRLINDFLPLSDLGYCCLMQGWFDGDTKRRAKNPVETWENEPPYFMSQVEVSDEWVDSGRMDIYQAVTQAWMTALSSTGLYDASL